MKNTRKVVKGSPASAVRCTELDFFPGAYKPDARKALARLAVKYVLANEYLKLNVTI